MGPVSEPSPLLPPPVIRTEERVRRNGFTLVEMLIIVVMIGIIVLMGWPRLYDALNRSNLRGAQQSISAMYAQARSAALQGGRQVWLNVNGNRLWITASPRLNAGTGTVDTVGSVKDINSAYGATVATTTSSFAIDPRGLAGSTGTITVTLAGRSDSVQVSGYGRVQ